MLGMRHRLLSGRQTAFTLVELLVVMFILAVLIVIIVSVAGYVTRAANEKETSAIQAVVMDAIQAFYDNSNPKTYPPSQTTLMADLTNVPASRDILLRLPKEAWTDATTALFKDSWGRDMRYEPTGGLGDRPVVISDGPDGQSGTDDDIRSDEHQ